jgi:hypothetical protein
VTGLLNEHRSRCDEVDAMEQIKDAKGKTARASVGAMILHQKYSLSFNH